MYPHACDLIVISHNLIGWCHILRCDITATVWVSPRSGYY
jgi:hypothetical protein